MRVEDVMSAPVVTAAANASLLAAAERMLEADVGSVVVTKDGDPAGILTEHDFVAAGHEHDRAFSEIPVFAAASRPLITIEPSATLARAAHEMRDAGVKRLPVADGLDLVGIVSAGDLLGERDNLDDDARRALRQRDEWTR
jgi:CBS domain-containing protein